MMKNYLDRIEFMVKISFSIFLVALLLGMWKDYLNQRSLFDVFYNFVFYGLIIGAWHYFIYHYVKLSRNLVGKGY